MYLTKCFLICVCVLHALALCYLVLACHRVALASRHLPSVVGVSPAHLGKKTSKLAWFSHSTGPQDGMCPVSLCRACVCVRKKCLNVFLVRIGMCLFKI